MLPLPLDTEDDLDDNPSSDLIEQAAEMLYGLIHARFILTNAGICKMVGKLWNVIHGQKLKVYFYLIPDHLVLLFLPSP